MGLLYALMCGIWALCPVRAVACAVCYGDPESPMTRGAVAGILVLGGFIGSVLLGLTGTALFWSYRGRVAARCTSEPQERGA